MSPSDKAAIVAHVNNLIDRSGLAAAALAGELSVSRQAIEQWKAGTSLPKPGNLRRLAELCAPKIAEETREQVLSESRDYCLMLAGLAPASER